MLGHTRGIDIETGMGGGFLQSLKRSVLGGESFFLNRFVAREPGSVTFAPRLPGDVIARDLGTEPLFVQSSSFLAGTPEVELDTKFGGFRTFFAGEGLFLLRLTGPGSAFLSSFGAIDEVPLRSGEQFVVDTGHVVAFESSTRYSVRRVGGLASTVLSGEGLVVEFEGPGTVWTQSRSPDAFLSWISANVSGGGVVPVDYSSDRAGPAGDAPAGRNPHRSAGDPRTPAGAADRSPRGHRAGVEGLLAEVREGVRVGATADAVVAGAAVDPGIGAEAVDAEAVGPASSRGVPAGGERAGVGEVRRGERCQSGSLGNPAALEGKQSSVGRPNATL